MSQFHHHIIVAYLILSFHCHPVRSMIELVDENISLAIINGAKCLCEMIRKHFGTGSNIAVIKSGLNNFTSGRVGKYSPDELLNNIMNRHRSNWTIYIKQGVGYETHMKASAFEKIDNYIIFAKTVNDIRIVANHLISTESWNPHGKFIIYVNTKLSDWLRFADRVYDIFWFQLNVLKVIVFLPQESFATESYEKVFLTKFSAV